MMKIKVLKVGYLKCNCYILEKNNKVLVIDPGDDYELIRSKINGKEILGVLITHGHFDHVGCVDKIVSDFGCYVYDFNNLEEKEYVLGEFLFEVIYTPGHSRDSVTFYFKEDNLMFTGDFLFFDTIGRCDLVGSEVLSMKESIDKIKKYDKGIKVYPGHGIDTTLGREFIENFYFNSKNW